MTRLLGIRNLTWDEIRSVNQGNVSSVQYKSNKPTESRQKSTYDNSKPLTGEASGKQKQAIRKMISAKCGKDHVDTIYEFAWEGKEKNKAERI